MWISRGFEGSRTPWEHDGMSGCFWLAGRGVRV